MKSLLDFFRILLDRDISLFAFVIIMSVVGFAFYVVLQAIRLLQYRRPTKK